MRIYLITLLLAIFISPQLSVGQVPEYFQDRLLIKYENEQTLQQIRTKTSVDPKNEIRNVLSSYGIQRNRSLITGTTRQKIASLELPSADDVLRIREIVFSRTVNPVQLAAKISAMPGVEYAEPKYIRRMSYTPNDPHLGEQQWVSSHRFKEAWTQTKGSRNTTIAIVDGGVGYTHPELSENLWVNQNEVPETVKPQADQNNDGRVTSGEIQQYLEQNEGDNNGDGSIDLQDALSDNSSFMDGIDTDNNGYTDDLFGWDFWSSGGSDQITQDNNPFHDESDHGTHVAGIAAANTDNEKGIAGAAFTATYLPVKAGGAPSAPDAIGFGFKGILYAARQNADIINCSWGGPGSSQAEQEIIDLATEMGSLVVASAGNESNSQISFPGGYDRVLSVGAVLSGNTATSYTNYGYNLDILAIGNSLLSTTYDSSYTTKSGTSMAAPIASGLAALVKTSHPGWSAERIGFQIRNSSIYIDDQNADQYQNKLGHGSIDADNALNSNLPGIKIISYSFSDDQGGKLVPGQPGTINIRYTNVGNNTNNLEMELTSLNESKIILENTSLQAGSVATGDTASISFGLTLSEDFDLMETPRLRVDFSNGAGYTDFGILQYKKLLYDILDANNILTSFASDGTVGFTHPLSQSGGLGFIPRRPDGSGGYTEGDNLLFEGGLMLEIDGQLYDAVRAEEGVSRDFSPENVFSVTPLPNDPGITGNAQFLTKGDSLKQASIDLTTYAYDKPSLSNVVFVKYKVRNGSTFSPLKNVYLGLFNDWDIGSNAGNNNISFNQTDNILYISDAGSSNSPIAAVSPLGPISGLLAIDNTIEGRSDSLTFGLYDGFTDSEKMAALTSGTVRTNLSNTDVSAVTATGPYTLNPGAEITVGFIYAFGKDYNELRNQIQAAREARPFSVSPSGVALADEAPNQTRLLQNYPNPFSKTTTLRFELQEKTRVTLTLYDAIGRKVRTIANREFRSASHFIPYDANGLSSGIYFLRLKTENTIQSIPITIIN